MKLQIVSRKVGFGMGRIPAAAGWCCCCHCWCNIIIEV